MLKLINHSNRQMQTLSILNHSRKIIGNFLIKPSKRSIFTTNNLLEQIRIKMPAFSPTMTEGTIVKWHKNEGDKISAGDTLFEVQTDKAVLTYDIEEDGILAKILKSNDSKPIQVGTIVGIVVSPNDDWKNVKVEEPNVSQETSSSTVMPMNLSNEQVKIHQKRSLGLLGPVAKMLISLYDIDMNKITGTGPHGLILKSDVKEFIRSNKLIPKEVHKQQKPEEEEIKPVIKEQTLYRPSDEQLTPKYVDIELTNMRKVIAKRLTLSKTTIPHSYLDAVCVLDSVIDLRNNLIKNFALKLSLNDFLIKALALALRMVPDMNSISEINSEGETTFKYSSQVDICVAVATDKGLITPIIRNTDCLNVDQISKTLRILADKARSGKLMPHEFQGGTFSISNLGMFGVKEFSAVINPPQVGILAVGCSQKILNEATLKPQTVCNVKLSFDERAVQIDRAIKFLDAFKYFLCSPHLLYEQIDRNLDF